MESQVPKEVNLAFCYSEGFPPSWRKVIIKGEEFVHLV